MTRGNHDIQFLFTKNHAMAIIYYIMKYISKSEATLHLKLTVAAAVHKAISSSPEPGSNAYITKSLLLDYAYRGSSLAQYCLYDYCAQFYKQKKLNGLFFDAHHPQHVHYSQFLRNDSAIVPTLLGKLLFIKPDAEDEKKSEDYY